LLLSGLIGLETWALATGNAVTSSPLWREPARGRKDRFRNLQFPKVFKTQKAGAILLVLLMAQLTLI